MRSPQRPETTSNASALWRWLLTVLLILSPMAHALGQGHTPRYYINRIQNYAQANAWNEAKREIDEGLNEYPNDPDLRYYNGRYFYLAGRLNDARYNLVRATQNDEMHFRSKRLLVDVEDGLKHYSSAICYINELLEFQPYDRDMWRRKIALYRKMGNHVEADAALQRLAHIYPNDSIVGYEMRKRNRENWNEMLHNNSNTEAANKLEEWLDLDPKNLEYYTELTNVYERMGEYDRALGTANRGLMHFPGNSVLIHKVIGLLTNRGLYPQALTFAKQQGAEGLYRGLLSEAAANARLNDPYEVNGRLYATTGDRDALNYLINTALTRGYYDDARVYLHDAMKRDGRTAALLMKMYDLERKVGNEQAAIKLLEELYTKNPADEELTEQYIAQMLALAAHEMELQEWQEAYQYMERAMELITPDQEGWAAAVSRQITILGQLHKYGEAGALYSKAVAAAGPSERLASAYEDVMATYLRTLIEEENYGLALAEAQRMLDAMPESETALRTCINMSQTLHRDALFHQYAQQGYEAHPDVPYFVIKYALALHQQGRNAEALGLLMPSASSPGNGQGASEKGQVGMSASQEQLAMAYAGIAQEWAEELVKNGMPDLAIMILDTALGYDPNNKELLYAKGLAYEKMKHYSMAYELQSRNYEPSNAEQKEWYERMRHLRFRSFKNRIDASYTTAHYDTKNGSLGSMAHLYSVASVAYSRLMKRNTITGQVSYKGIDGYHTEDEDESGGAGLEVMGQWDHVFNRRWSGFVNAAYSTRYFNKIGANVSASYAFNRGWTPSLKLGYRRTPETYLYLSESMGQVGTSTEKLNLFLISPSVTKAWERISVSGGVDLTALSSGLYYNVGLKGKLLINDDNVSSVGLLAGFGSFPELSFFDQTSLQGVSHTNAMLGFEGQYLCTRNLYVGLSFSWNTCYDPYRRADGTLSDNYRNIFTLSAQVHVAF